MGDKTSFEMDGGETGAQPPSKKMRVLTCISAHPQSSVTLLGAQALRRVDSVVLVP